jgi:hypothetical protein
MERLEVQFGHPFFAWKFAYEQGQGMSGKGELLLKGGQHGSCHCHLRLLSKEGCLRKRAQVDLPLYHCKLFPFD